MTMYAFSRCSFLRNAAGVKNVNVCNIPPNIIRFMSASLKSENEKNPSLLKAKIRAGLAESMLSKSMKAYLKRAMDHEELMKREIAQYTIGKRHLANMMGKDPETFTQKDINDAIKYLFPSGLFDPKARPSMLHPNDTYPAQKEAQFDSTGRPFHFLFYTVQSNYYEYLYNIAEEIEVLNSKEEAIIRTTGEPVTESKFNLIGSDWLSYEEVCGLLRETLEQQQYKYLIVSLQRLIDHPLSSEASELINKFRKKLRAIVDLESNLPIQKDENGRPYVVVELSQRKTAIAKVIVRGEGTGKISINGEGILYFPQSDHRDQIVFPLIMSNMIKKVDIEATVSGSGPTAQAGAIRWAIAWGLRSFVDKNTVEKMRIAGLLTKDWRRRERKKFGQEGARRKFTWKKR